MEIPIAGLAIAHDPITFADVSTGRVNISIDTGSQVNWTCFIDNNVTKECSDYNLDWETAGGKNEDCNCKQIYIYIAQGRQSSEMCKILSEESIS